MGRKMWMMGVSLWILFSLLEPGQAAPPQAMDITISTFKDAPVEIILSATDEDIVPDLPTTHPLVFGILKPPTNGELRGNLQDVVYEAPHRAKVRMLYVPRPGFLGRDSFVYIVTDPFGFFDTATVWIDVVRPPIPPSISGVWEARSTFRPTGINSLSVNSTIFYTMDIFKFTVSSSWSLAGWNSLSLGASFPLGTLAQFQSDLSFNPETISFVSWQADTRFSYAGLNFTYTISFDGTEESSSQLSIQGLLNGVSLSSFLVFGFLRMEFRSLSLTTRFIWPRCDIVVTTKFKFTKTGFDHFSLTISNIPLTLLTGQGLGVSMSIDAEFALQTKKVSLTFSSETYWVCCARAIAEVESTDTKLTGVNIYGFEIRTTSPNGIELWLAASIDPAKNSAVTGYAEYFEVWMLSGPVVPCCGALGRWQLVTYFGENGSLFGWGRTRAVLDFGLTQLIRGSLEVIVRKGSPVWELKTGIRACW
jgi:hypothetical protein